jgi:hypothetical protein
LTTGYGTDAIVKIVDHWTLLGGKAISLWAAYFEPQAVLDHQLSAYIKSMPNNL